MAATRRGPALAAQIEACTSRRDSESLVAMLGEDHPIHEGRTTNEVEWMRADILVAFETIGLPDAAAPFVLEELETGTNPRTVAAAARALRGAASVPPEAPTLLVAAIRRLRGDDDVVSFDRFGELPPAGSPTALGEIAATLTALGAGAAGAEASLESLLACCAGELSPDVRAQLQDALDSMAQPQHGGGCCHHEPGPAVEERREQGPAPGAGDVVLEDQDGRRSTFEELFRGRPSVLAFFYTRCMNPQKCSLTVTRLARIAARLQDEGVAATCAGISYDPRFDRPGRLRTYGLDRGMAFSSDCMLLRTVGPFDPLRDAFELGVGYGPVTVNRHRLELLVLDPSQGVAERFERRLWDVEEVLDAVRRCATVS